MSKKEQERVLTLIETTENAGVVADLVNGLDKFQVNCLDIWVDEFEQMYRTLRRRPSSDKITMTAYTNIGDYTIIYNISNVSDINLINEMEGKIEASISFYNGLNCCLAPSGSGKKLINGLKPDELRDFMTILKQAIKDKKKTFSLMYRLFGGEKVEKPEDMEDDSDYIDYEYDE